MRRRDPIRPDGLTFLALATLLLAGSAVADDTFDAARRRMVDEQLVARGIRDARVIEAMRAVPRHRFVPASWRDAAYDDGPLPIGEGQTISQPFIVARMTELAELEPGDRVFEIGTGSGYQAAIASRLATHVWTMEIHRSLAERARDTLADLGYDNVTVRAGDGYHGWPEKGPFDAIFVTAAATHVPPPLVEQLRAGGRMIVPVGPAFATQRLMLVEKREDGSIVTRSLFPVRFVPLTRPGGSG